MDLLLSSFQDVGNKLSTVWSVFTAIWYFILPPLFYFVFKPLWDDHVHRAYWRSVDKILLEVIPPQNIEKSPKLMESFFNGLHGVITTIPKNEELIQGRFVEWFSVELVGDSGTIHFYIHGPRADRGIVESNIYAQYPDAQIFEADDYTKRVPRILPNKYWEIWGADASMSKEDPLPIKTYNKFQEDVTGKMIDPLSSILEILGRLGPNQKIWFQIIFTPVKENVSFEAGNELVQELAGRKPKSKGTLEKFISDIMDVFKNIFTAFTKPVEFKTEEKKEEAPLEFRLTPGEKDKLKALEENVGRNFFKTKIRFIYLGRRENFDKPMVVGGFWGAMKQFSDLNSSGISIEDSTKTYAWYFMTKTRLRYRQRILYQRYIDRDWTGILSKMSTAELATVFHMPDMSAMAPTIPRVEAKRGGAPANLPVK